MKRKMGNNLSFYLSGKTAASFQPSVLIKGECGRSILGQEAEMYFLFLSFLVFIFLLLSPKVFALPSYSWDRFSPPYFKGESMQSTSLIWEETTQAQSKNKHRCTQEAGGGGSHMWRAVGVETAGEQRGSNPHFKPTASQEAEGDSRPIAQTGPLHKSCDLNTVTPSWNRTEMVHLGYANQFLGGKK